MGVNRQRLIATAAQLLVLFSYSNSFFFFGRGGCFCSNKQPVKPITLSLDYLKKQLTLIGFKANHN